MLVIGGGVAGLAAAEAAAATGARVIIADENPMFGGLADISGGTIGDASQLDWVAGKTAALAEAENVHVLTRTTAVGHWHHNYVMLFERLADHDPALLAAGTPRQRLWKVRAHQVILATGAIERPIAFANNDRPGVMLASAARAMVERYGVAPGSSGVIFTNNDDAYQTALVLKSAGVLRAGRRLAGPRRGRAACQGARGRHRGGRQLHHLGGEHQLWRPRHRQRQGGGLSQGPGPGDQGEEGRLRFRRHVGRMESGAASLVP